jgi:hypothetical protein
MEWAGDGYVTENGTIEDCPANLEEGAYEAIEEQIQAARANGLDQVVGKVTVTAPDGREVIYHWQIED